VIVLDASVALKWFIEGEPLADEARRVRDEIEHQPDNFIVPDLFFNEVLSVLVRLPSASSKTVRETIYLLESLGMARIANGHELLRDAAEVAMTLRLSGYDAIYVAVAASVGGQWLTADARAAARVKRHGLVKLLG
jgi:predicted nucleic acid-binding protein